MMKKRQKTKNNHQAEWLQLTCWGKKWQMESHAWVRLWEMCSGILRRQKKTSKSPQNKVLSAHLPQMPTRSTETLVNAPPSVFSRGNADRKRSWTLSDHPAYFHPSSKATTEEKRWPQKMGSVTGCSPDIIRSVRSLFSFIATEKKKPNKQKKKPDKTFSTCLLLKKMKCTILKWHFVYRIYTLLAHGHSKLDLFSFRGFKW